MEYRIDKEGLYSRLGVWNSFLNKRVHMIACGGTALTLLGIKPSTKDIDLIIPNELEYRYLLKVLKELGYKSASGWGWARDDGFIFDLFVGKRIHTTELLQSPLNAGNNIPIREFSHIYLGVLNYYDIIISKIFRCSSVDIEDCLALIRSKMTEIDKDSLVARYRETSSYDATEDKINKNLEHFLAMVKKEGLKW